MPVDISNPEPIFGEIVAQARASVDKNNSQNSLSQTRPNISLVEMIKEASEKYGIDDDLAVEIARCESGLRQYSTDGTLIRGKVNSKDVGVFQINEDYHLRQSQDSGFNIYTTRGNIEYAMSLLKKSGSQPWSASKPCWGQIAMR